VDWHCFGVGSRNCNNRFNSKVMSASYNQAINGQVAEKNSALNTLNANSGKEYLTGSPAELEQTAKEKSTLPGENPKVIGDGFTWWKFGLILLGAFGIFYIALKNKWIRI
jgi:hypothetical protein